MREVIASPDLRPTTDDGRGLIGDRSPAANLSARRRRRGDAVYSPVITQAAGSDVITAPGGGCGTAPPVTQIARMSNNIRRARARSL